MEMLLELCRMSTGTSLLLDCLMKGERPPSKGGMGGGRLSRGRRVSSRTKQIITAALSAGEADDTEGQSDGETHVCS